jgi:carnitine-CoA ligase
MTQMVLKNLIKERARATPDRVFARDVGGSAYSYGEIQAAAKSWAVGFRDFGLRRDERVLTMVSPNCEWLSLWLGLSTLGAVDTGINTSYKGHLLRYAIQTAKARFLVIDSQFMSVLSREVLDDSGLIAVVVLGDKPRHLDLGIPVLAKQELIDATHVKHDIPEEETGSWDTACILMTSGTTGPSKLVIVPWGVLYSGATGMFPFDDVTCDDSIYCPLPVYHAAARFSVFLMAIVGGSIVFRERFSADEFWTDVTEFGCSLTVLIPAIGKALQDRPVRLGDIDNPLRGGIMSPLQPFYREFAKRFGVKMYTAFGTSEIGVPIVGEWDPADPRPCGRIRQDHLGIEARLVDEHDIAVPEGEVGELVLRAAEPWTLTPGYVGMPEATAAAWRNGWYHTGDGFRQDHGGQLYFVDRMTDSLRRRGHNISSFEIEMAAARHPGVAESAAVRISAPDGEDDVLLCVVRAEPELTEPALIDFLIEVLPRFMVPTYVEFVESLPKTEATFRVKKNELRARGLTSNAWERPPRKEGQLRLLSPPASWTQGQITDSLS